MNNREQAALWNDVVGDAWVRHVNQFDLTLEPFGRAVIDQLDLRSGDHVLDVGCGVGSTTYAIAALVAPAEVVGVDISAPMLEAARRRSPASDAANVRFVEADVEATDLGTGVYDVAFSRLGVMFFSDPTVAFSNIAAALKPGGRLGFVCFQPPEANPFIVVPMLTAAQHLALPPRPGPDAPGPFALADSKRTTAMLSAAGFEDITMEPGPTEGRLYGATDIEALATRLIEQNPATSSAFAAADDSTKVATIAALAQALLPHRDGDIVSMDAATWIVRARTAR